MGGTTVTQFDPVFEWSAQRLAERLEEAILAFQDDTTGCSSEVQDNTVRTAVLLALDAAGVRSQAVPEASGR